MRAVIQRVNRAKIIINSSECKSIKQGLVVLLGIENEDTDEDVQWLAKKIVHLRIFDDSEGQMNLSIGDISGDLLVVSQFTLHASTKKGNRPSWIKAASPDHAKPMYDSFTKTVAEIADKRIVTGTFGAHMSIELENDGPVTLIIDTKNRE